jgi:hypothetical protein
MRSWNTLLTEKVFWIATGERAVKTFAQALVALFVAGVTVLTIDWQQGLAVAATAALVSVLTSIASVRLGSFEGPSLAGEAVVEELPVYEVDL